MRYSTLLLALGAVVTAVPLGSDAPTPVDAAVVPRSTPNPQYVSSTQAVPTGSLGVLTSNLPRVGCLHHRLHEGMRHQPAPMHVPVRPGLRCAVSSDPAIDTWLA